MRRVLTIAVLAILCAAGTAVAQEHWTEGPVWVLSFYRTEPGKFDDYMKYLRTNYLPTSSESKKQGLNLDSKIYVKAPSSPNDWDVAIAVLYPSYAKAMDYNAGDDAKGKAIQEKHWKTADQDKQRELSANRLAMRTFIGIDYVREVNLKPMP